MTGQESVHVLPGIGPAKERDLLGLGVRTVMDLVRLKPRAYDDRREERFVGEGGSVACLLHITGTSEFPSKSGRTLKVTAADDNGTMIDLLCFNRPFLRNMLVPDSSWYTLASNVAHNRGRYSTASFECKRTKEELGLGEVIPVYPLSGGLTQKALRTAVGNALDALSPIPDELPQDFYPRLSLMHHADAYRKIHFPSSPEEAASALRTLKFTELFLLLLPAKREKARTEEREAEVTELEEKLLSSLPFSLTDDQKRAADEIRRDLDSGVPMNRLLQGDVGSGKTLVAWLSALHAIARGGQVAYMAPTELLARQHADSAAALFGSFVRLAFLSGDVKAKPRKFLLEALRDGSVDLVIGTHALFSKDVVFRNLKYVIVDEEHRFGVQQRQTLREKGSGASVLSMSATPIPRTLALTVYADTSVSTITTMPEGRLPITTYLVSEGKRETMYSAVAVEFERGHQAYFVYPRIDDAGDSDLRDVTSMYSFLREKYPGVPSALIHSRLDEEEKIQILHDFKEKKLLYLVATSVVEVGIDVPDATCMVIEHAETFGLAALHQLRGRVGRSSLQSYCFLVFSGSLTETGKERLKVMKESTDGFLIAERDLEIRGPGDMAGSRQSGFLSLHYASLTEDPELVDLAVKEADRLLEEDRGLIMAGHDVLRKTLGEQR